MKRSKMLTNQKAVTMTTQKKTLMKTAKRNQLKKTIPNNVISLCEFILSVDVLLNYFLQ